MSKQTSNQLETRRFSGPELSELLDRVVSEHGSTAAISAVNRIRSGGVAGFFCREEFEIVVEGGPPAGEGPADPVPEPPTAPALPAAPSPTLDTSPMDPAPTVDPAPRVDPAPTIDPVPVPPVSAGGDGATEIFGGPRPRTSDGTDPRFAALLERRLEEASATEATIARRQTGRARPSLDQRRTAPTRSLQPIVPAPGVSTLPQPLSGGLGNLPAAALARSGFWLKLQRAQHELASFMPLASPFIATIGPLSLTTAIARRLRTMPGLGSADVVVLTDRAEIVSEPSWQLVRSGHQLLEAAQDRQQWPTLLVIDVPVELPHWVAPLQNRLRMAGVGLFRYAVPGCPTTAKLDAYRLGSDVPYVLDLVSRVEPARVVEFIDLRHPIASVAGADLNAELLVAMREQVSLGA